VWDVGDCLLLGQVKPWVDFVTDLYTTMDIYRLETLYGHMTVTQGFVIGDQAESMRLISRVCPDLSDNLFSRSGKLSRKA
jgi:hypothetical protein